MTYLIEKFIMLLIFSCLVMFLGVAGITSNAIDISSVNKLWELDLTSNNPSKGKLESISNLLNSISQEQKHCKKLNINKASTADIKKNDEAPNKLIVSEKMNDICDIIEKKQVNRRNYFPENVQKLEDLPTPVYCERSKILSLLSKDSNLDLYTSTNLSPEYNFLENIVTINNTTMEMSGLDLLRDFISDIDSICRLSSIWFDNYPNFVQVLRKTDKKILGKYKSNEQEEVRLSRRFTNDWINFLNLMKTIKIDSKTYRQNRRKLRNYKEINHKDLKQYRKNIYNELQLFNNLLLIILSKFSFYIEYIVYFPNTGKLFDKKQNQNYLSQFKQKYQEKFSNKQDLLKLNRIDIYVNRIPKNTLKELRTSISSCSQVVKVLNEYGINLDSTPNDIITLYLQYKRITRILLNVYNSEINQLNEKYYNKNYPSSQYLKSKDIDNYNYDYTKNTDHLFKQKFYPNNIGFKPFQDQKGIRKIHEKTQPKVSKRSTQNYSKTEENFIDLKFYYLSNETVNKFFNENERNLFQQINQDLTSNQLNKGETISSIANKRPSGSSGLIIFSQKYDIEHEYDSTAKILPNGNIKIDFNNNMLSNFHNKIIIWFKNNYLKHFYNEQQQKLLNSKNSIIPLQFKLVIACPYVISQNCMQNNYSGGMNDVFILIYLVGKLKGYNDDWTIVTEFNAITAEPSSQWKILTILIPDIQSHVGKMCSVQANSLKSQVLKESKHVIFKNPVEFESLSEEFKYENADIKSSIIRNCLNYVHEETVIEFLTNDGKDNGMAVCRNNYLYIA